MTDHRYEPVKDNDGPDVRRVQQDLTEQYQDWTDHRVERGESEKPPPGPSRQPDAHTAALAAMPVIGPQPRGLFTPGTGRGRTRHHRQ